MITSIGMKITSISFVITGISLEITSIGLMITGIRLEITSISLMITGISLEITGISLALTSIGIKIISISLMITSAGLMITRQRTLTVVRRFEISCGTDKKTCADFAAILEVCGTDKKACGEFGKSCGRKMQLFVNVCLGNKLNEKIRSVSYLLRIQLIKIFSL